MSIPIDFFTQKKDIHKYSNPSIVVNKAKHYDLDIFYSPRDTKKYRIINPITNKFVDFGYYGMEDYTYHKNKERRRLFRIRNHRFKSAPMYSPSWLSYYLLW